MKAQIRTTGVRGDKPGELYLMLSAITAWCLVILMAGGPSTPPGADFGRTVDPFPAAISADASTELTNENASFAERYLDLLWRTEGS